MILVSLRIIAESIMNIKCHGDVCSELFVLELININVQSNPQNDSSIVFFCLLFIRA